MKEKSRSTFSGNIGFVLAAAGSAVGLGNIWRFPYLAAKDGGGLFLLVYLILVLTFGFALLTTEIAIGRKTGQGPLTAYGLINPKGKFVREGKRIRHDKYGMGSYVIAFEEEIWGLQLIKTHILLLRQISEAMLEEILQPVHW